VVAKLKLKIMSYREKDVIAEFTKGNFASDCLKYNTEDLIDMFDETLVSDLDCTVNDCIENDLVTRDLVVIETQDNMFCFTRNEIDVPCSAELDYEFYYQSI
jgi:hypothetical protein